jgi:hypothetical protein
MAEDGCTKTGLMSVLKRLSDDFASIRVWMKLEVGAGEEILVGGRCACHGNDWGSTSHM